MKAPKILAFAVLLFAVLIATGTLVAADKVAYVVSNPAVYSSQIKTSLESQGFTVDIIDGNNAGSIAWAQYRFMVVGDNFLSNPGSIPVNTIPSVIVNSYHMPDWKWSRSMGITTSNQPLTINVVNTTHYIVRNLPGQIQVYTSGKTSGGINIPLYYLPSYQRAAGVQIIASTMGSDYEATVGVVVNGTVLLDGTVAKARECFFGMVQDGYWTSDAQTLFKNCAYWVAYGGDYDSDGILDDNDVCPFVYNPSQNTNISCGTGTCSGIRTCGAQSTGWSACSTQGKDVGVCAKCDENGTAIYDSTQNQDCNDNLFCNGIETCKAIYQCNSGTAVNCTSNNLPAIASCSNNPDSKSFTWDTAAGFTSICDEANDKCTTGSYNYTFSCDKARCNAGCESNTDCASKCIGTVYYSGGVCNTTNTCACNYATEDCASHNGWYNTTTKQWITTGLCTEKEQLSQQYRNYACSVGGCTYTNTSSQWIDTGNVRNKADNTACDDGQFCTVNDKCTAGVCSGASKDCTGNNLPAIASCSNNPDSKSFTWDTAAGFTSICDEANDKCTTGSYNYTFSCDKARCNAGCESNTDCASKCIGTVYYSGGICDTASSCACSYQTQNCSINNGWYNTTTTQWLTIGLCTEKEQLSQQYRSYTCSLQAVCSNFTITNTQWIDTGKVRNKADNTACDDGQFCTVNDKCTAGVCSGASKDCTSNNLPGIASCSNNPDSKSFTWDTAAGFTSLCDEANDKCTTGSYNYTFSCDKARCNAGCESNTDCANKCIGTVYYSGGVCNTTNTCACNYATEDCASHNGWYNTTTTQAIPIDQCRNKEQLQQEYRNYACSGNGCTYTSNSTQWIDTGKIINKQDGTSCDDGLFCSVNDKCTAGVCGGASKDCTSNNLPAIASCSNNPDSKSFTWDTAAGFTSLCDETNDKCTTGSYNYTFKCDKARCNAGCESNTDCASKCINNVYYNSGACDIASSCACSYATEDCSSHNGWYNTTSKRWLQSGACTDKEQVQQEFRSYICSATGCSYIVTQSKWIDTGNVRNKSDGTSCDDGQFCTIGDQCTAGVCGGATRDCSDGNDCTNDLCSNELAICAHTTKQRGELCGQARTCPASGCYGAFSELYPADGHDTCDGEGSCTQYSCTQLSKTCSDNDPNDGIGAPLCGAECDTVSECANKCVNNTYYHAGTCDILITCGCSYTKEDCSINTGWYDTGNRQWVDTDICKHKEQREMEYRVYGCSAQAGCGNYTVNQTKWEDTGLANNKIDGTACDDGKLCTLNDVCAAGICAGTQMDCSANSLPAIASCNNDPDNNPLTFDSAPGFTSQCIEGLGCTQSNQTIIHACDKQNCSAECTLGETQTQPCGTSNAGECKMGTQTRSCTDGCTWDTWSECTGAVNPSQETCDGKDNNCDGQTDENLTQPATNQKGLCAGDTDTCSAGSWIASIGNYQPTAETCDGKDNNCDGQTDENLTQPATNQKGLCAGNTDTCSAGSWMASIGNYQPTTETCDGKDNNCDGQVDEGLIQLCGEGACAGVRTCSSGGFGNCSTSGNDAGVCAKCDQNGITTYDPTQVSDCNDGLFCNGQESCSGIGQCAAGTQIDCNDALFCTVNKHCDEAQDKCVSEPRDCSVNSLPVIASCNNNPDNNPLTFDSASGFTSTCDEQNRECTTSQYTFTHTCNNELCGAECTAGENQTQPCGISNVGECKMGIQTRSCTEGCTWEAWSQCTGAVSPTDEICDGKDNNCNGQVDENLTTTYYLDADGDSYGDPLHSIQACTQPSGYSANSLDCDDSDASTHPGATELVDNKDQNCVNDAPVLVEAIPDISWPENTIMKIDLSQYLKDPDGNLTTYASSTPVHVKSEISGNMLTLTPDQYWSGQDSITIQASDGQFTTPSNSVTLTVTYVNQPPKLDPISDLIVTEGDFVMITPSATDVDNDTLTFHFTSPLNAAGQWQTNYSSSGAYTTLVSVDDGKGGTDSQQVHIQVLEWGNHLPVLNHIDDVTVTEGDTVHINPTATDIDGDALTFQFTAPLDSTGSWKTNYTDSGDYNIQVTVDDHHGGTASQTVGIQVLESGNHAPILDPLPDFTISEGDLVKVVPHAVDPDGDKLTITFTPPLDADGKWQTTYTDAGVYPVSVGASDGNLSAVRTFKITVLESGNHNPILQPIPDITVTEGEKVSVTPIATDPDDDPITFSFSAPLDAAGQWQTNYSSSGTYTATVTAHDNRGGASSKPVKIIVTEWGNHAPVLEPLVDVTVTEGETVQLHPVATDIDGDKLTFHFTAPLNSAGAWKTNYTDVGEFTVQVSVDDGKGGTDSKSLKISVLESGNHAPVVEPINDITIIEGELAKVMVNAYDPDGDPLTITYTGVLDSAGQFQSQKDVLGDFDAGVIVSDGTTSVVENFKIHVIATPFGALRIDSITVPDTAKPGDRILVSINLKNTGTKTVSNLKTRGTIAELATTSVSKMTDLKPGKTTSLKLYLDIPSDAVHGEYDIRLSIDSDDAHRVKYRPITIVG